MTLLNQATIHKHTHVCPPHPRSIYMLGEEREECNVCVCVCSGLMYEIYTTVLWKRKHGIYICLDTFAQIVQKYRYI